MTADEDWIGGVTASCWSKIPPPLFISIFSHKYRGYAWVACSANNREQSQKPKAKG